MALETPVAGALSYGIGIGGVATVSPAYPAGILTTDAVLLFVGQKPNPANAGTVTTPTGWTLREELTGAGGYGTTLLTDVGNTNLRVYSWNTPVAGQTGNLTVALETNEVSWAYILRVPTGGGKLSYGSADGQRTTAPTSPMTIALTNGASPTAFKTGDLAIWAMCIPTDVTTPTQFSAQVITATGATFATAVEINEPDSSLGYDIGGYNALALVTAGASSTAPTITVGLAGTITNVRGPVVLLRIRETPTGSLSVTEAGTDAFSATGKVIVRGALAVSETSSDLFTATGTISFTSVIGSLAVTETGSDTLSVAGKVTVQGSLVVSETGKDTLTSSGKVTVKGALTVTETGKDTLTSSGNILVKGLLTTSETGSDTFIAAADVFVLGTASLVEIGSDTFSGSGTIPIYTEGSMAATEAADSLGSYAVDGYFEEGYTLNGWEGFVYYEIPLPSTVLAGTRYGPHGIYVGTLDAGGTGTRIEITSGKIVKLVGDTGALIIN